MKWIKRKIINWLVRGLYKGITEDDVLRVTKRGDMKIGKVILSGGERNNIIDQAKSILEFELWELLQRDIQYSAEKKMCEKSASFDDVYFGKAAMWNLDMIRLKLDKISRMPKNVIKEGKHNKKDSA